MLNKIFAVECTVSDGYTYSFNSIVQHFSSKEKADLYKEKITAKFPGNDYLVVQYSLDDETIPEE